MTSTSNRSDSPKTDSFLENVKAHDLIQRLRDVLREKFPSLQVTQKGEIVMSVEDLENIVESLEFARSNYDSPRE
jgi:hypothetical protein